MARQTAVAALLAVFAVLSPLSARAEKSSRDSDIVADVIAQRAGEASHGEEGHALDEVSSSAAPGEPEAETSGHDQAADHAEETSSGEDGGHGGGEAHEVAREESAPVDPDHEKAIDEYIQDLSRPASTAGLQPYQLIRSLQFVQDSVVQGDHSAMEMQRYLLGVIDERLRQADQSVFDNPRNVDAALVYAMSGGNPETLELLAAKDRFGNFDNEITTVLRAYLDGTAVRTQTSLDEILEIYADTRIGAYLALIAANVKAGLNEEGALEMFDLARLNAPGTIIEEAALRRSLFVASSKGKIDKAIHYATLYARRFIDSPYAGQYADQLVELGSDNIAELGTERLQQILAFMDEPRQREVYLRISRKAAIAGKTELALLAADTARKLSDPSDPAPAALAGLYSGLASVPSDEVVEVDRELGKLQEMPLSPRDAALRDAARIIANEIIREPDPNSLTQAFSPNMEGQNDDGTVPQPAAPETALVKPAEADGTAGDTAGTSTETADAAGAIDESFRDYLEGQNKLIEEIDGLLSGNDGVDTP